MKIVSWSSLFLCYSRHYQREISLSLSNLNPSTSAQKHTWLISKTYNLEEEGKAFLGLARNIMGIKGSTLSLAAFFHQSPNGRVLTQKCCSP